MDLAKNQEGGWTHGRDREGRAKLAEDAVANISVDEDCGSLGTAVYRARCSRSASSSMTRSSGGTTPMRAPMRSTATDLTCSACAFESRSSPVFDAGRST